MKNVFQHAAIVFAFSAAIGSAHAAGLTGTAADFGAAVNADAGTRIINIDAGTKYVNVQNGETVQFIVQGQAFTWHFDTFHDETAFKLSKIAPAGVMVDGVEVYVAPNPLYRG